MGNTCCGNKASRKTIVLLLLGLDNAGKTVAVKNLAGEPLDSVVPTIGFSIITLQHLDYDIKVFDLGGRSDFRDIWDQYYVYAHGVIFVVDSSDYDRLNEAQAVLTKIISHEKIRGKPLLLLANKQDNEHALDEIDLIEKLQLERIVNRYECPTLVESTAATEPTQNSKLDPGIKRGYNWIINYIKREYANLNERVEIDVECQEESDRIEREAKIQRIKYLNEREESITKSNGFPLNDVYVIKNNKLKHSDSDSSRSSDSLPHLYYGSIQQEFLPNRPKSATSIVRQHLELENLHRKPSFKFPSNKTTPVHMYGLKRQLRSAGEEGGGGGRAKSQDRRNLKSAGDSIFIVSNAPKFSLPATDGSGDLQMYEMNRNVLPPINDTRVKLKNGDANHVY